MFYRRKNTVFIRVLAFRERLNTILNLNGESKMKKIKTQCHICQKITKSETPPDVCPECGTNLVNRNDEMVRKSKGCSYNKGAFGGNSGWLYLTNKRVIWIKSDENAGAYGGGLVGALVAGAVDAKAGDKMKISIPLDNLQSAYEKRRGLFGGSIVLTTKDGAEYDISPGKRGEWLAEFQQIISGVNV